MVSDWTVQLSEARFWGEVKRVNRNIFPLDIFQVDWPIVDHLDRLVILIKVKVNTTICISLYQYIIAILITLLFYVYGTGIVDVNLGSLPHEYLFRANEMNCFLNFLVRQSELLEGIPNDLEYALGKHWVAVFIKGVASFVENVQIFSLRFIAIDVKFACA